MSLTAEESHALRRWAYMTALVRSLLDRGQGMAAPAEWFRSFHASAGDVPSSAVVIFGRIDSDALLFTNRMMVIGEPGHAGSVIETAFMVAGTLIVTVACSPESAENVEGVNTAVDALLIAYPRALARLSGKPITLTGLLPTPALSAVRAPMQALAQLGWPPDVAHGAAETARRINAMIAREGPRWPPHRTPPRRLEDPPLIVAMLSAMNEEPMRGPAEKAYQVHIPALSAMLTIGWILVGGGVLLLLILPQLMHEAEPSTKAEVQIIFTSVISIGVGLLIPAWVLLAIKQMIHRVVHGWQPTLYRE